MQIKSHTFIVSGGAGGLGEQVVRSIVEQGGRAVIFDISEPKSKALVKELGRNAYFPGPVDVTSEDDVSEALKRTAARFPQKRLAGAILCSGVIAPPNDIKGYGPDGVFTSYRQFEHIVSVNLLGTYNVAQQVAQYLIKNEPINDDSERGVIITVSSITGLDGVLVGYGTSKAGIAGLTLPLARELSGHGIRVMNVAPGPFETPMMHTGDMTAPLSLFPKRYGKPVEFADLVSHIISNTMLNGTVIRLDGGLRA